MKILIDFARAHPHRTLSMLVCLLVAGMAEGVSLLALLPLLSLVTDASGGESEAPTALERGVIDVLGRFGIEPTVGSLLLVVAVGFLANSGLVLLARREVGYTMASVIRSLRTRLVRAILRAQWDFFLRRPTGAIATAYVSEAQRSSRAFMSAATVVSTSVHLVVYVGVAIAAAWEVALVGVTLGIAVTASLAFLVRTTRRAGVKRTQGLRSASARLADIVQGLKPIKAMGREEVLYPLLEEPTRRLEKAQRKQVIAKEGLYALQDGVFATIICAGFYTLHEVYAMPFSQVALLAFVLLRLFKAGGKVQKAYQEVASDESAYEYLLEKIEDAEGHREDTRTGADPSLEQAIVLDGVRFAHGERTIFRDLSLRIAKGEITAVTGASGIGKTTMVDLIAGLLDPDGGSIRIDDRELESIDLLAWRHCIGYVPQETFLLHDSIAMNVSLGDASIGRDDVERALRAAHAWEFVEKLADGIDQVVGERGSRLSGGQRQRSEIARALGHRPWLLVLDEATANLDPESEAIVWQALKELRGRTTVLAISHQPALLEVADRVYRIEDGRACELRPEEATSS